MFQKINKLSDLLLSLLHTSYICKFYLDISQSFDLKALLVGDLRDDRIRCELPEDEESNGDSQEGCYQSQCIPKCVPKTICLMIEVHFYLLEFILLVVFQHGQKVIDVSIKAEYFRRTVLISESYLELWDVLLLFVDVDLLDVFQQFLDKGCFVDTACLQGLLCEYFLFRLGLFLEDNEGDNGGRKHCSNQFPDIFSSNIYLNIVAVFLFVLFLLLFFIAFHFLLLSLLLFSPFWPGCLLNVVIAEVQVLEIELVVDPPIDSGICKLRHQNRDVKRKILVFLALHDLPVIMQRSIDLYLAL